MTVPLRIALLRTSPGVMDVCRLAIEGEGRRVTIQHLERPDEVAGVDRRGVDVLVGSHVPPEFDATTWLPLLCRDDAPPAIVVSEEADPDGFDRLRRWGALAVVGRWQPEALGLAVRLAEAWTGPAGVGGDPGPEDRRRMAALMGVVGHNLRDLLGGISNAVEVLTFQCGEEMLSQRRAIEFLDRQCRRMAGLLDDYAEIARIGSRSSESIRGFTELGSTLERAIDRARIEVSEGSVRFERPLGPEPLWMLTDERRLEQLVRHALNYTRRQCPGCNVVRIGWQESDDRIDLLVEALPRAASPAVGSGPMIDLDLFMAATLADRLDGRVRTGLPLVIELPRSGASPPDAPPARVAGHPQADLRPGASRHVLLVDDDPQSVQVLGLLIGRLGWRVRVTPDVGEALEVVRRFRPEVVLIDLNMPVMDGVTLARQIRRDAQGGTPLLIGISGLESPPSSEDPGRPTFDHFLPKPVCWAEIAALLPEVGRGPAATG